MQVITWHKSRSHLLTHNSMEDTMTTEEIKQYCIDVAKEKGYYLEGDDASYMLLEADWVWEGERDSHRWWDCFTCVVEVGNKLFSFENATTTGDESAEDKGWEFDWDTVEEVERVEKEVTKTVVSYEPVKQ